MPRPFNKALRLNFFVLIIVQYTMPVSLQHKFKFIHIPRTGGSSIEVVFDLQHKECLYEGRFAVECNNILFAPQHVTHKMIDNLKPQTSDYFSFTIVRNPFTKVISEYFYINRHFYTRPVERFEEDRFYSWIKTDLLKFDFDHKLPQTAFLDREVDFTIRFEEIEKGFRALNDHLGTDYRLIHDNSSGIDKYAIAKTLGHRTRDLILKVFEKDFKMFDYPDEL